MSKEHEEKRSVLRAILDQVYQCPSRDQALIIVKDHLEKSNLPDGFKKLMIGQAEQCETLVRLQSYITNSFLKYEGMGTRKIYRSQGYTLIELLVGMIAICAIAIGIGIIITIFHFIMKFW